MSEGHKQKLSYRLQPDADIFYELAQANIDGSMKDEE